ncbi:MAG: nucleotidyltransferase domain-containing protein [Nanoarchaeota archaeon]|nr:nucleotidyltransferase domain-containing protein [Nanoarchaeota archaeon]
MININKPKLTNLQREILLFLLKSGKTMNQREIAKKVGVSDPAVMKALPGLKEKDLILLNKGKESKRWTIGLNEENPTLFRIRRVENLDSVYKSGLSDFLEESFPGSTIILFGSYSRGEDTANSDIDIAIIGRNEKKLNLDKFEDVLGREINMQFYSSFKEIHKNLRENIFNGIVLTGGIEL